MELTQENLDKLTQENENYKKALQEERSKRKEATADSTEKEKQLTELMKFKQDLEEKESKKKGKYEELLTQKDSTIQELTGKFSWMEDKATKYDLLLQKSLDDKMWSIPKDRQEFVTKVLWDKSYEDKVELLDGFIQDYTKPNDFKNKPEWKDADKWDTTEFQKAKESWDIMWLIGNAPIIE